MRSFFTFAFLFFLLTACSSPQATPTPQVTVTRFAEVTVTSAPTATPTIVPAFFAMQEQIAGATQDYTIVGNGQIEGKLPDGTIGVVPGIKLNPDGKGYTIMVDGQAVTIDASDVTITDAGGVQVAGYENVDNDDTYEKIVKSSAQLWAEQNNGGFDLENGVAWDKTTGLVMWAKDAKGEWINYPDGNVPIPPGPGYENEPPLLVPYYHSFNEAMKAVTNELPWGELARVYREKQNNEASRIGDVYWLPQFTKYGGTWTTLFSEHLDIHVTTDPKVKADVGVQGIQSLDGEKWVNLSYNSAATGYYFKRIFIHGDPQETYDELKRIDDCAANNRGAENLAELCASETIQIEAPKK